MTTILVIFLLSLILSFSLTPLVGWLAQRFGVLDKPCERKIHAQALPTAGGIAIYLAFYVPFVCALFYSNRLLNEIFLESSLLWLAVGSTVVFALGLIDDIYWLTPKVKLAFQGIAALLAYAGGVRIVRLEIPFFSDVSLGWMSLPATLFWFVLVINAINLIDGLDGLAAGVSLFVSLVLLVLSVMGERYVVASGLAAVAGASLGFLCFNFNPASIFMGDGGSYFLGFMLAGLSILGSMKSQATVAILIPIIALGVPLMDAFIAPIRRVVLGKGPFQADTSHIHHKLLKMGLNQRRAVLWMYGVTILFGVTALIFVQIRDERGGFLLLILGLALVFGVGKLGYLRHLAVDRMMGYFNDVTDEMGLKKERRTFLNRQIAVSEARDIDEMWDSVIEALETLKIDHAEIQLSSVCLGVETNGHHTWSAYEIQESLNECEQNILSIALPLVTDQKSYGMLYLKKNLKRDSLSHYTLKRIEHLRRSIVRKLSMFEEEDVKLEDHSRKY
jgi:UDP-GlcNAc:undecaprenyl-phosphate GlcNAc-1-phosphate transferase